MLYFSSLTADQKIILIGSKKISTQTFTTYLDIKSVKMRVKFLIHNVWFNLFRPNSLVPTSILIASLVQNIFYRKLLKSFKDKKQIKAIIVESFVFSEFSLLFFILWMCNGGRVMDFVSTQTFLGLWVKSNNP